MQPIWFVVVDQVPRKIIENTPRLQHFDIFQMMSPSVEPQDIPVHLRHYFTTEVQLTLTDKFPFLFSRGTLRLWTVLK